MSGKDGWKDVVAALKRRTEKDPEADAAEHIHDEKLNCLVCYNEEPYQFTPSAGTQ